MKSFDAAALRCSDTDSNAARVAPLPSKFPFFTPCLQPRKRQLQDYPSSHSRASDLNHLRHLCHSSSVAHFTHFPRHSVSITTTASNPTCSTPKDATTPTSFRPPM